MNPPLFSLLHTAAFLERLGENAQAISVVAETIEHREPLELAWLLPFLERNHCAELLFQVLQATPVGDPLLSEIPAMLCRLGAPRVMSAFKLVPTPYRTLAWGKLFETNSRFAEDLVLPSFVLERQKEYPLALHRAYTKTMWLLALQKINPGRAQAELAGWMEEPSDLEELARLIYYPRALQALYGGHPQVWVLLNRACTLARKVIPEIKQPPLELGEALKSSIEHLFPGLAWNLPRHEGWNQRWEMEHFEQEARLNPEAARQSLREPPSLERLFVLARVFSQKGRYKDAIRLLYLLPTPAKTPLSQQLLEEIVVVALKGPPPSPTQSRALFYKLRHEPFSNLSLELWVGLGRLMGAELEWWRKQEKKDWQKDGFRLGALEERIFHRLPVPKDLLEPLTEEFKEILQKYHNILKDLVKRYGLPVKETD